MIIAALAGIKVFATGGIGGVHRGAEHTSIFLPICKNWQILMSPLFVPGRIYSRFRINH